MIMRLIFFTLCVAARVRTDSESREGCGFRNEYGIGFKIKVGIDEAQYGEFPWMAMIFTEEGLNQTLNVHQCEASVVSPEVVLTAAHCVDGKAPKTLKVRAGDYDTQTKEELLAEQNRNVIEVIVHPDYNKEGHFNDIALLFLEKPFEIEENVKTVCLPPATISFDGSRCFVTCWGSERPGKYNSLPSKIDVPIVPSDTCQTELRKTQLGNNFDLHNSVVCAGGEPGKDTCNGAGGSPLVCPIPGTINRYYQAGLVSWGPGPSIPVLFASVAKLRPWIDEQLAHKSIKSSFYTP